MNMKNQDIPFFIDDDFNLPLYVIISQFFMKNTKPMGKIVHKEQSDQ